MSRWEGFAVQICYMRYPGIILSVNETPFLPLLNLVADKLKMSANVWNKYGKRDQTQREHLAELHPYLASKRSRWHTIHHL